MTSISTRALAAGAFAVIASCADDTQKAGLRPAGPPDVLAVLVANDRTMYGEVATYCRPDDPQRPGEVGLIDVTTIQVCSADLSVGAPEVMDADPLAWRVRIMFDELLDPDIEELIPILDGGVPTGTKRGSIKNTHPVELTCGGVAIDYDGYYSPSGNRMTWPLGPALVIVPDDPTAIPAGTECEVTINQVVVDKQGEPVPAADRGPYRFQIAPIALASTTPTGIVDPAGRAVISPEAPVTLSFNALLDPATVTSADVQVFEGVGADCTGGTPLAPGAVTLFQMLDDAGEVADPQSIEIADATATDANPSPDDPMSTGNMFEPSTAYRIDFPPGAMISDIAGGEGALEALTNEAGMPLSLCFETDAAL